MGEGSLSNYDTAIHEAAHFISLLLVDRKPSEILLYEDGGGTVRFEDSKVVTEQEATDMAVCVLAGARAQSRVTGEEIPVQYTDNFQLAKALDTFNRAKQKKILNNAEFETNRLLDNQWNNITTLAKHLCKFRRLSANDAQKLLSL